MPKDDGQTYYEMPKTTKSDGMERMATRFFEERSGWIYFPMTGTREDAIGHLKTLLRKVAREAARKQRESSAMVAHNWLYEHGICDGTVLVVDAIRKAKVSA